MQTVSIVADYMAIVVLSLLLQAARHLVKHSRPRQDVRYHSAV
jgi:hypothetical protein